MNSCLYSTEIIHERFYDFRHKFKYFVLSILIDHDELKFLSKKIKFFSYNKFNIFSFYEKDHGYRDGRSLRNFIEDFLNKNQIIFKNLQIKILCFPRIFGYAFNPLSVIYCYDNERLIAIFYEVKNTSNEQHIYCFAGNNLISNNKYNHKCKKNFYVSPFIGMKAVYKFSNLDPEDKISIIIDLFDKNNNKILTASQYGDKVHLNSYALLKHIIRNPFAIIKVIFAIMYEAFFIFNKGGRYYKRIKKKSDTVSFEGKL